MEAVELYQSGKWTEDKLFVWAVQGVVPTIDPQTNMPYSLKDKKDILLKRIELRLGYYWKKKWENGYIPESERIDSNWLESGF